MALCSAFGFGFALALAFGFDSRRQLRLDLARFGLDTSRVESTGLRSGRGKMLGHILERILKNKC